MKLFSRLLAAVLVAAAALLAVAPSADAQLQRGEQRALLASQSAKPTWAWDFARTGMLPPGSTYARSGARSCWNSSGVLVSLSANVPCFDFDPATKAPLGYLSEMASTNSYQRSQEIDNAYWTKQRVSITADQIAAPDGTTTADKITEDGTSGPRGFYKALTLTSGSYYGYSLFVKAGTRDKFFVSIEGSAATRFAAAMFDLSNGTVSETKVGSVSGTIHSTLIRSIGSGWYRVGIVASVADTSITPVWGLSSTATGLSTSWGEVTYSGDGVSYAYAWGAQVEDAGVGITSYIPTAGATASRTQDVLSLPLTSLPGWSASRGGVLVAAYRLHTLVPSSPGFDQVPAWLNDGSAQNQVKLTANYGGGGFRRSFVYSGNSLQIDLGISTASPAVFTRTKQALGWGTSRGYVAYDGTAIGGSSGSYSLPAAPTTLNFGSYTTNGMQGTLESIAYYRGARSDQFVQGASR